MNICLGKIVFPDEICYEDDLAEGDVKTPKPSSEKKKKNRALYAVGIICAVGILLISVGVHFVLNSNDEEN